MAKNIIKTLGIGALVIFLANGNSEKNSSGLEAISEIKTAETNNIQTNSTNKDYAVEVLNTNDCAVAIIYNSPKEYQTALSCLDKVSMDNINP